MTDELSPDALKAANALRRSVAALTRRLRRLRADHDLSPSKLLLLGRLALTGQKFTAAELAETEGLKPQSLTRVVADLDARGLLRRERSGVDRRAILLEITREGRDLLVADARRQNRWLAEAMVKALTPAERDVLLVAAQLLDRLSEEPPAPQG